MKAAAHSVPGDPNKARHRQDFAVLTAVISARDFREADLSRTDRRRLRAMVAAIRADPETLRAFGEAERDLSRLERAAQLTNAHS